MMEKTGQCSQCGRMDYLRTSPDGRMLCQECLKKFGGFMPKGLGIRK